MQDGALNRGVRGVFVGVLIGVTLAWFSGVVRVPIDTLHAQSGQGVTSNETGTISWTSSLSEGGQLLYIIDTKSQAFAVYRVDTRDSKGAVKLEAARQYRWDLKLAEFNNQAPEVATIESMVAAPRR